LAPGSKAGGALDPGQRIGRPRRYGGRSLERIAMLPFTREQFISVFAAYNGAVWPLPLLAYLLAIAMVLAVIRPTRTSSTLVAGALAAMWAWTGIAYHWVFFTRINTAAWAFGALFVAQALLVLHLGALRRRLSFASDGGWTAWLGWTLVAYAAIAYPLLGVWVGHGYPEMPMFGITPCPLTIFTFGMLMLTNAPVPRRLLVIPVAWSLIGGSAAFLLDVPQDWLLLFSGLAAVPIVLAGRRAGSLQAA
jgi:hypothetical protein